ncbi:MAG: type II toxin-antitoxin system MqsA family antitoxin [bacterium]|jgi:YgiT-type zinc finger domain-containing protein
MKCVICKTGETKLGETTVKLEKNGGIFIFRGVPAEVCDNCGEAYLDEATSQSIYDSIAASAGENTEITVRRFAGVR